MTTRVKLLKAATYAREALPAGRVVVVDRETGRRWLTAKLAVETREPVGDPPRLPDGHRRVKVLQETEYCRDVLPPGTLAVVDAETATRWLAAKLATEVRETDGPGLIRTACPKCGAAMQYPDTIEPTERWVSCGNAACRFGWLR